MFYHARFYDPALGTFISPDTMVPEPGRVSDYNRFAYTRNNPLRYSDPTGHCPKPDGEFAEANIICLAGFIPTETSTGIPKRVYFQGDNRDFSNDSPKTGSRFWLWLNADTGDIARSYVHPTQRVTGPNGDPVGNSSPPRNVPSENWFAEAYYGSNHMSSSKGDNGSITLSYGVVCSDSLCNQLLAPNGEIIFRPTSDGSYSASGKVNEFPNLEAYHWNEGVLQGDYLFRIQNFSEAERKSGHAGMGSSVGMATSVYLLDGVPLRPERPALR